MVLLGIDGRRNDGAILSKDKVARSAGTEPLDYGSTTGEDLLYQSSDSLSENGFKESALRVVSYSRSTVHRHRCGVTTPTRPYCLALLTLQATTALFSQPRSSATIPSRDMRLSSSCSAGC